MSLFWPMFRLAPFVGSMWHFLKKEQGSFRGTVKPFKPVCPGLGRRTLSPMCVTVLMLRAVPCVSVNLLVRSHFGSSISFDRQLVDLGKRFI